MNARAILADLRTRNIEPRLHGDGLKLRAEKGTVTPDLLAELKPAKPAIVAELKRRARRDEVLMLLADHPGIKYAYVTDTGSDPVIVAMGIRGLATFEMTIAADRFDPWKLAALIADKETNHD